MDDLKKALADIGHIRGQIASVSRFHGFTPPIIALTGFLAIAMAVALSAKANANLSVTGYFVRWVLLAIICSLLIATDAILRARSAHRMLADKMLKSAFRQFAPAGMVGAAFGVLVLFKAQESAWLLPGLWQMLVALGAFAALPNLPPRMIWAVIFYFLAGIITMSISSAAALSPWAMGLPFGIGQLLVAIILFDARTQNADH